VVSRRGKEDGGRKATRRRNRIPTTNRSHRAVTRVSERTQIFACDPRRADAWRGGRRPIWPVWTHSAREGGKARQESSDGPRWASFVARSALPANEPAALCFPELPAYQHSAKGLEFPQKKKESKGLETHTEVTFEASRYK
jgi:hypothetical protein